MALIPAGMDEDEFEPGNVDDDDDNEGPALAAAGAVGSCCVAIVFLNTSQICTTTLLSLTQATEQSMNVFLSSIHSIRAIMRSERRWMDSTR